MTVDIAAVPLVANWSQTFPILGHLPLPVAPYPVIPERYFVAGNTLGTMIGFKPQRKILH